MNAPPLAQLADFPGGADAGSDLGIDVPESVGDIAEAWLASRDSSNGGTALIVVRTPAGLRTFINRCPHFGTPLNALQPQLWDRRGRFLMCQTHGALFDPQTGECRRGPCKGQYLRQVAVEERGGRLFSA